MSIDTYAYTCIIESWEAAVYQLSHANFFVIALLIFGTVYHNYRLFLVYRSVTNFGFSVLISHISSTGCFVLWPSDECISHGGSRDLLDRSLPDTNFDEAFLFPKWTSFRSHSSFRRHFHFVSEASLTFGWPKFDEARFFSQRGLRFGGLKWWTSSSASLCLEAHSHSLLTIAMCRECVGGMKWVQESVYLTTLCSNEDCQHTYRLRRRHSMPDRDVAWRHWRCSTTTSTYCRLSGTRTCSSSAI